MSMFAVVQRALPFSSFPMPWKRQQSPVPKETKDTKEEEGIEPTESTLIRRDPASLPPGPDPDLHRDVAHTLHVAVKQHVDPANHATHEDVIEVCKDDSEITAERLSYPQTPKQQQSSVRTRLARVVSWANIVPSQCRWTSEQERELKTAQRQLARCQKAWSSEQELWLTYIEALTDEKEAHDDFLLQRSRQQEEERNQFRKAWKRRRSVEKQVQRHKDAPVKVRVTGLGRLRRLQRYSYLGPMATTGSAAVACRG
ncbi:hypothetical protein NUU61_003301 [Penicillium alfredii]|uniref:Uncharacterized protein n=1 Tax=Penicillium alfredii TaxID=1506179 RepID=A0A9W9FT72_9EURO|nr:uncharacterized protein NUU61_003301 [Penicillium alfredii]KAJ5105954.1 hypothetical protein NUU61_003301 [Penicillium alfredii]